MIHKIFGSLENNCFKFKWINIILHIVLETQDNWYGFIKFYLVILLNHCCGFLTVYWF